MRDSGRMELLDRLRELASKAEHDQLTRGEWTEARHTLLFVGQEALATREDMAKIDYSWVAVVVSVDHLIAQLEALRKYIRHEGPAPVHPNELAGSGAPPAGVIIAEQNAKRAEQ